MKMASDAASLLVAWQLNSKTVLIIGGGEVASNRLQSALITGAFVRLIAPSKDGLHPFIIRMIADHPHSVVHHDRCFTDSDLGQDVNMVLTAIDDVETSQRIAQLCRDKRIPVNAADLPTSCDFYFGSQINRGPLQIMVSTNGKGPKLANIVRQRLEAALPERVEEAIKNVGALRMKLRARAPGVGGESSQKRMEWMSSVCTRWELEELAQLNEGMTEKLLDDGWEKNQVPSFASLKNDSNGRRRCMWTTLQSFPSTPQWLFPFITGLITGISGIALYSKRR